MIWLSFVAALNKALKRCEDLPLLKPSKCHSPSAVPFFRLLTPQGSPLWPGATFSLWCLLRMKPDPSRLAQRLRDPCGEVWLGLVGESFMSGAFGFGVPFHSWLHQATKGTCKRSCSCHDHLTSYIPLVLQKIFPSSSCPDGGSPSCGLPCRRWHRFSAWLSSRSASKG